MITIVTDSTVYMTKGETAALGVKMVSEGYYVAGNSYDETFIDQNGDFQSLLASSDCKTFHANNSIFSNIFEELLRQGQEILCITISSRLSGTYSSALIAARETKSDKIIVVDSLTTAGGLFLLIKKAREFIAGGKTLAETAFEIEKLRSNIVILFSVDDMAPLRRSGRLGIVRQSVNTILNVKPFFLCIEGSIVSKGVARGNIEQIKELIKYIPKDTEEIIVHSINNSQVNAKILKALQEKGFTGRINQRMLGPVLGIHLGLGVIGVAWLKNE